VVTALETWVFGAILAIVGFLVIACGLGENELGVSFIIAGGVSASVGSLFFVLKFKEWIDKL
jgi:predicted membrane channel-forming protein YqfA (hemolysin III family)